MKDKYHDKNGKAINLPEPRELTEKEKEDIRKTNILLGNLNKL